LRWPGIEKTRFVATSNPGGVGHSWVKSYWIDRAFPTELQSEAGQFAFVKALPSDNPSLPRSYWEMLNTLPEPLRLAWVEGRWDVFTEQAFAFNPNIHVVKPVPVPADAPLYMTFDWGFGKPYSVGWWWVDADNRLYRFTELYGAMPGGMDVGLRQTDQEIAERIIAHERKHGIEGRIVRLCDPTCFNKKPDYKGGGQGESTAEVFARAGLNMAPGDANRKLKFRQLHQRLRVVPGEMPMLVVYPCCTDFIRTIQMMQIDPHDPEEILTTLEDHCLSGNTLVDTINGQYKIKDMVGTSGFVYTIDGIKPYSKCRLTRKNSSIINVALRCGCVIQCTPDHKLLTTDGWIEAGQSKGRVLCVSQSLTRDFSCLMENDSICVESQDILEPEPESCFIESYIKTIKEKFQRGCLFIIETGILQIIKSKTLNVFRVRNIGRSIHGWVSNWIVSAGFFQRRAKNQRLLTLNANVINVERNFLHDEPVNQKDASVPTIVARSGITDHKKDGLQKSVLFAERTLKPKMQMLLPVHTSAGGLIVDNVTDAGIADVYCMTVEEGHAFSVQGGVIVHNCVDETCHAVMARPVGNKEGVTRQKFGTLEDAAR
jgi:hypothetical protein